MGWMWTGLISFFIDKHLEPYRFQPLQMDCFVFLYYYHGYC